jgi:phage tail-like protein
MSNFIFPPPAFYFKVTIGNDEMMFQEVNGLEVEMEVVEVMEGGMNEFKHRLPGRTHYKNLVLKRGLVYNSTKILNWMKYSVQNNLNTKIDPKSVTIELLKETDKSTLVTWNIERAYPVKWSVSNLHAQQNAIAIESIEFAYKKFEIQF